MQQAPAVSVPVQNNVSRTTVVVACFGAVVAVVPLVAVAILARGVVRGKHAGTKEVV